MTGLYDWKKFKKSDWKNLAKQWFSEIRQDAGKTVVAMNFTASPQLQWQFILLAVSLAGSDKELGHIAAGPIEHLLGWHGEKFIDLVEEQAMKDHKFARALTGVFQYKIPDEIWSRLEVLISQVEDPLSPFPNDDDQSINGDTLS